MHSLEIIAQVYGCPIIGQGSRDCHLPELKATRGVDQHDGLPILLNIELIRELWN